MPGSHSTPALRPALMAGHLAESNALSLSTGFFKSGPLFPLCPIYLPRFLAQPRLVYCEGPLPSSEAVQRERQLKRSSRAKTEALIGGDHVILKTLSRARSELPKPPAAVDGMGGNKQVACFQRS